MFTNRLLYILLPTLLGDCHMPSFSLSLSVCLSPSLSLHTCMIYAQLHFQVTFFRFASTDILFEICIYIDPILFSECS